MADFYYVLNYPAQLQRKPAVTTHKFGEGYSQRVGKGLNSNMQTWTIKATDLDLDLASSIDTFLSGKGGTTAFTWDTPLLDTNGAAIQIRVICQEWNVNFDEDNDFSATFQQVP